jgi:hypothetical protein
VDKAKFDVVLRVLFRVIGRDLGAPKPGQS